MIGRPHASMRAWQGVVDLQIPEPKIGTGALKQSQRSENPISREMISFLAMIFPVLKQQTNKKLSALIELSSMS